MKFQPFAEEREHLNQIEHCVGRYPGTFVRLTPTMIDKCIIDASGSIRYLFEEGGFVSYESLAHGGRNGVSTTAILLSNREALPCRVNMYRVANKRGDCRFSIAALKRKVNEQTLFEGDLLYFFYILTSDGTNQLYIVDLTNNIPTIELLTEQFKNTKDEISTALDELMPMLKHVVNGGPYNNVAGIGKIAPKDAGDTFEHEMGINTNNDRGADYKHRIEFKTKLSKTLDTLFTLRPSFDGTAVAKLEPSDRSRVSAFTRLYGYDSDAHRGMKNLYITIGSKSIPKNEHGFYLAVDYDRNRVNLMHQEAKEDCVAAYWPFKELKQALLLKHPATLWINTEVVRDGTASQAAQFQYTDIHFSRSPQFTTFLSLIEDGFITYDWRGYTTPFGKYSGKNHGNAWRIDRKHKDDLFDSIVKMKL